jgi:hypothetical protein
MADVQKHTRWPDDSRLEGQSRIRQQMVVLRRTKKGPRIMARMEYEKFIDDTRVLNLLVLAYKCCRSYVLTRVG